MTLHQNKSTFYYLQDGVTERVETSLNDLQDLKQSIERNIKRNITTDDIEVRDNNGDEVKILNNEFPIVMPYTLDPERTVVWFKTQGESDEKFDYDQQAPSNNEYIFANNDNSSIIRIQPKVKSGQALYNIYVDRAGTGKMIVDQGQKFEILSKINRIIDIKDPHPLADKKIPIKYKNAGFSYMAAMVNAIYNLPLEGTFKPYIGAGGGIAKLTFKGADQDNKAELLPFALQGKAGVQFDIGSKIRPYIGYRGLYFTQTQSLSPLTPIRHKRGHVIAAINNDVKTAGPNGKVVDFFDAGDDIENGSTCKISTTLPNGSLVKNGTGLLSSCPISPATLSGNYSHKVKASYLLHNVEVGITIPFDL